MIFTEAFIHGVSRLASAGLSFVMFAMIARYNNTEDAKAIYFFSFAIGFFIVTMRTFQNMSARLDGTFRRTAKLTIALRVTGQLVVLQVAAIFATLIVLIGQRIPWPLVLVSCVVVPLAGFDADLMRAALHRRSWFSLTFAAGGALGVAILYLMPASSKSTGCAAILAQWVPVLGVNLYWYLRLILRRARLTRLLADVPLPGLLGSLLVAVFDGAILNAPFLSGNRLSVRTGIDLSLAMRIFISSLPLYPLVLHWSNNSTLATMAKRFHLSEPRLYGGILVLSGWMGGLLLTGVFIGVSHKPITLIQYLLSVVLLAAYCAYATSARYCSRASGGYAPSARLFGTLALFGVTFVAIIRRCDVSAVTVVALQSATLVLGAIVAGRASFGRGESQLGRKDVAVVRT